MTTSLGSFSQEIASLVESFAPSVLGVYGRPRFNSSGLHWSPGVVVTAEHTLRRDDEVYVIDGVGAKFSAEVAGRDPGTDLAVLKVKDFGSPTVQKADGTAPRAGNLAIAIGRNKGSTHAGVGVISSVAGPSQTWRGGSLTQVIRLDMALHPVASGAAVVDASGKMIGLATPALSRVAVFAVPNATIDRVVQLLLTHGRLPQGYLGAGLQPIRLPEHLTGSLNLNSSRGLMTISVEPDAPAGKAGWTIGDVLIELNGHAVDRPEALRPLLAESVGKTIVARVIRGGNLISLEVAITERPRRS